MKKWLVLVAAFQHRRVVRNSYLACMSARPPTTRGCWKTITRDTRRRLHLLFSHGHEQLEEPGRWNSVVLGVVSQHPRVVGNLFLNTAVKLVSACLSWQ